MILQFVQLTTLSQDLPVQCPRLVGQSTVCLWSGPFLQICEGVPYSVKSALGNTKIISHFSVATLVSSKCQCVSAGALNSTPNRAFSKGLGKAWPQTASDY